MELEPGEQINAYVWSGIALTLAIWVVLQFNLLAVNNFLSDRCVFSSYLHCEEFSVAEDGISVSIRNAGARPMTIVEVEFESKELGNCFSQQEVLLRPGDLHRFTATGTECISKERLKSRYDVTVEFKWSESNLQHFVEGKLLSKKAAGTFIG